MKRIFILTALVLLPILLSAQEVSINEARFCKGDDPAWHAFAYDDHAWQKVSFDMPWEELGLSQVNGLGWYRLHVVIPSSLKKGKVSAVLLDLGAIDDSDETWVNGHSVGKTGTFPEDPGGYSSEWGKRRYYVVDPGWVRWDQDNVIAVRVYNYGDPGGFYRGAVKIVKPGLKDFATLSLVAETGGYKAVLATSVKTAGSLQITVEDVLTGAQESSKTQKVNLAAWKEKQLSCPLAPQKRLKVTYTDPRFEEVLEAEVCAPYILTPPAPATPRYNGPAVFGVRPGSPVIFRLAFSGDKPMKYAVEGLPEGVVLDPEKGVLSGSCAEAGEYPLVFTATNDKGSARAAFTLFVGEDKIGLTPPMGWNSWNCWALSVSQEKVMASAAALINRGLADYGYSYMNIDDAWEADERTPDGRIQANEKFPDMKGLGDWLHSNGLKFGIYSSPGDHTCGGYLGSLDHEKQDAEVWNSWGVDYLKYDWCGYSKVFEAGRDRSEAAYIRPYLKMQQFLREQPRDIFYSLCQYGWGKVWEWGTLIDANSWRTSHDINDTWESLYVTGFERQPGLHPYAGPGHWNDPDMLIVGKVGWSSSLRDSRLTPDEQYTHISLWSLLAANMLIGCDIAQIDDFTFNLLCNNEVNAVNQDILGHQAHQDVVEDGMQIWSRDLFDGAYAVGIFNLNEASVPVRLDGALAKIGLKAAAVRDLWRQKDIPTDAEYVIPPHGVLYVKVPGMTGPGDLIPAPVEYSVLPGSIRTDGLTQMPADVRISESDLRQRLNGRKLADWQLQSAYWLEVGEKGVKIVAADGEGVFYARQSLKMLASLDSVVTCCTILDWPRFRHRGLMLDESRNFQGKEFVLKQLDMMALLKMNRFHFHLVDNPGWRLQIDAYPRLTQFTAWRPEPDFWDWEKDEVGGDFLEEGTPGAYGGYYTKQDIAEILAFAAERHIEVIPEIEMPGHNYETRAAYPELACSLPAAEMHDQWELCPGKESTYEFLEKVLLEVFELFPSEYVHIGGDEAGKKNWERCPDCQARMKAEGLTSVEQLQSYLIKRIERFAHGHGKRIIGWDEILEGGLAPDATVMSWRGTAGGLRAIADGHDVIFTPTTYCYLDYHQDPNQYRAVGKYLPLEKVYSFDPMEEGISAADAHHVLGVQGNLWTEWVHEAWHAEMMLYPRAFALAETGWSPAARKDYPDFERRASAFAAVARAMGYTVYGQPDN
jgi:hypothetical protein